MRLSLKLLTERDAANTLPLNMQYEMSASLYKSLYRIDQDFAKWLHEQGVKDQFKNFKYFTFSRLQIPNRQYQFKGDHLLLKPGEVEWLVTFALPDGGFKYFSSLLDQQEISVGNKKHRADFRIRSVEQVDEPDYREIDAFYALSPICVSKPVVDRAGNQKAEYLHPGHEEYKGRLIDNLWFKLRALDPDHELCQRPDNLEQIKRDASFSVESDPQSKLIKIKQGTPGQTQIRGYLYRFSLHVPPPLIKMGYQAGVGEKNPMGFGMIGVNNQETSND